MSYKVNKTVTTPSAFTGNISIGNVNSTEIGYLDGVTAPIQTQLNGKQASDADLTAIAGLAGNSGFLKKTAANTWTLDTNSYITGNQTITISGDVSGSGTTSISATLATVNSNVGTYGSATLVPAITVDAKGRITSVVDTTITLPQSAVTGLTTALNSKAPIASPTFTGTPSAPTAAAGTNTTQLATTAFVTTAVSNVIDSAPGALDTLNELAAALGDDPNFATTITNSLAGKQPLSGDLSAIDNLSGSSGFLKKTAVDTWVLDTNSYLTGNQTITLSGDVSGSGTTSISVTVADDSHNHVISNVDGLQTALDSKAPSASPVFTGSVTTPLTTAGYVTTTAGGLLGSVSSIPGTAISGNISGNAGSATVLATARTINGTSFNGSANITTANWGNARTITLGDTGKSVNGSANVSWTLTEIGAADKDITLTAGDGLSGGGNLTANRSFAVDSTVVRTTGTQSIAGLKTITDTLTVGTSSTDPAMEFAGGTSTIGLYVLSDGTLSFQGSSGELFSISDSLLGTIFSVNDISGIPMFEIQDTGEINMAHYAGSVGIGNTSPTEKVDVTGNVKATSFIGPLTGNADTATKWATARTITLGGDLTGNVSIDGSANVTLTAAVVDDSHNHIISNVDGLQTALDAKAPLASPTFTGTPAAPTAAAGTNTTQLATTAFVQSAVSNLVDSAPTTLNTLNELAAALGDDPNFATTVTNSIGTKLPLAGGTMTGDIVAGGTIINVVIPTDATADPTATVAIGLDAANAGNSQFQTTAVGWKAQSQLTSGKCNTALGIASQENITSGMYNTAIGLAVQQAWQNTFTGNGNTGVGCMSQNGLTTGNYNTAVGNDAQRKVNTGSDNTGIGREAQELLTEGNYNTAVGRAAQQAMTSGDHSVAVGNRAQLTGNFSDTVIIGSEAITDHDGGIAIGRSAQALTAGEVQIGAQSGAIAPTALRVGASLMASVNYTENNYLKLAGGTMTGDISMGNNNITGINHLSAATKSFDIEHPTKPNMRLKHGSLEGPEHGVYVRGVSSDTEIELPDYWSGLVDDSTITVQLTPKGSYQNLYVENIVDNKVIVGGVTGEFFFFVQAERKDIDKLVVEYGG